MLENFESEKPTTKETTIEILEESGVQISQMAQETNTQERIEELPVPLEAIENDQNELYMSEEVIQTLKEYYSKITNPETAFEYPILLSGNFSERNLNLTNIKILKEDDLNNEILKNDSYSAKQFEEITNAEERGNNLLISTHTHPTPSKTVIENSVSQNWSEDIKNRYKIKELGLNLSFQDIHQIVYLQDALEGFVPEETKVMGAVLMHNGDFVVYSIEEGKLQKFVTNIKEVN